MTIDPDLTQRQREVAALVAGGHTDKQIAARLGVTDRNIRVHIASVAYLLGIPGGRNTRVLIARWYYRRFPNSEIDGAA